MLLWSMALQSCTSNLKLDTGAATSQPQASKKPIRRLVGGEQRPQDKPISISAHTENAPVSPAAAQVTPAVPLFTDLSPSSSPHHTAVPSSPRTVLHNQRLSQSTAITQAPKDSPKAQAMRSAQPTQMPSAPLAKTEAAGAVPVQQLTASGGQSIRLSPREGHWQAQVTERIGHAQRQVVLPVVCAPDCEVAALLGYEAGRVGQLLHVAKQGLDEFVYIGRQGLQGGMQGGEGVCEHEAGGDTVGDEGFEEEKQIGSPQGAENHEQYDYQGYSDELLKKLRNNDPKVKTIDLRSAIMLTEEQIEALKESIKDNKVIGYIDWGHLTQNLLPIKEIDEKEIDEKLLQNTLNYNYHPTDYMHVCFSKHIYDNPQSGAVIKFDEEDWRVEQVHDDGERTGFYSALYVNEAKHQAVLTFQGTQVKGMRDLMRLQSDVQEDIDGVLGGAITKQQSLAYKATKAAVDYVSANGFHLSITGHSLGGFLAELAVLFCYKDFNYEDVRGIVFDSPGSAEWIKSTKPNIENSATKFHIEDLPITTYLSAPNLINSCNGHPGTVYRLYPEIKLDGWSKRAAPLGLEEIEKGLRRATQGHLLQVLLPCFDPATGKPISCKRVDDWPRVKKTWIDGNNPIKKSKNKKSFIARIFPKFFKGLIRGSTTLGTNEGTMGSLVALLEHLDVIELEQFWATLQSLDEDFTGCELAAQDEFDQCYKGHYQESPLGLHEDVLNKNKSIDYYLLESWKCRKMLAQSVLDKHACIFLIIKMLKDIVNMYDVKDTRIRPQVSLKDGKTHVEILRNKMRRVLEVLPEPHIQDTFIDLYTWQPRTKVQPRTTATPPSQLCSHIPYTSKLAHFVGREQENTDLARILRESGICVVFGCGGVGKSTFAENYGHQCKREGQAVRLIPAETPDKLRDSFQLMAQELGINWRSLAREYTNDPNNYYEVLSSSVYNALEKLGQATLLILDNAKNVDWVKYFLHYRTLPVQVIITTRDAGSFEEYGGQVQLNAFSEEEGKEYLRKRFEAMNLKESEEEKRLLLEAVGCIPQALALASGYLQEHRTTRISQYLGKIQAYQSAPEAQKGFVMPQVSLGLEDVSFQGQQLLHYCSYLDSDYIPISLLSALLSPEDMEESVNELWRLSLVTLDEVRTGLQVHREVQAACRQYFNLYPLFPKSI